MLFIGIDLADGPSVSVTQMVRTPAEVIDLSKYRKGKAYRTLKKRLERGEIVLPPRPE